MNDFAKLERVVPPQAWTDETAFSDWLIDEFARLGDAVGLNLCEPEREKNIGRYYADIICRDLDDPEVIVVIENQFTTSDHDHLGKIITYAGGMEAKTIIWIAPKFHDEHLTALRWLNANTGEMLNFIAVKLQVWKIGTSQLAPAFEVVVEPEYWRRSLKQSRVQQGGAAKPLTDEESLRREFWNGFRGYLVAQESSLPLGKNLKTRARAYLSIVSIDVCPRIELNIKAASIRLTIEFSGLKSKPERSRKWYEFIKAEQPNIETEVGFGLSWTKPVRDVEPYPYFERSGVDFADREGWPVLFAWIDRDMTALRDATKQRLETFINPS
jgi:hypothetical protein